MRFDVLLSVYFIVSQADVLDQHDIVLDQISLLQTHMGAKRSRYESASSHHFWPSGRGRIGHYSQAYDVPEGLNLTASFAWSWKHPPGLIPSIHWGSLIDKKHNIYVVGTDSIYKLSPEGRVLWKSQHGGEHCSINGNAIYGMRPMLALMFALDIDTGKALWTKKVAWSTGVQGDMVAASSGVVVAGVDSYHTGSDSGTPSKRVIGVNASSGSKLWTYTPECGLWNLMAMFPDDETTAFMDECGGAYRLGLHNGSVLWKQTQPESFTDGGAVLDAAGDMYTCSSPKGSTGENGTGVVRKYRMHDGKQLWEAAVDSPCVNFPAISAANSALILAPGGLAAEAKTKDVKGLKSKREKEQFYQLQLELVNNQSQRSYYGLPDLKASIRALDTHTGKQLWRHNVEPWGALAFAGDEERAWNYTQSKSLLPHCWPSHWSGALTFSDGRVYIGRSTGDIYVYDPKTDTEDKFHTGDGILMGGLSSAPGMLVATTCSSVHVFKF